MKKRLVTTLKWSKEQARETNLHLDSDRYQSTGKTESIWLEDLKITSISEHFSQFTDNKKALGKYHGDFFLRIYGNDSRVKIDERISRRLEELKQKGLISGFQIDPVVFFFDPVKGENFTRTALKVAAAFFQAFGVENHYLKNFMIFQKTEVWNNGRWINFAEYLLLENNDIFGLSKNSK